MQSTGSCLPSALLADRKLSPQVTGRWRYNTGGYIWQVTDRLTNQELLSGPQRPAEVGGRAAISPVGPKWAADPQDSHPLLDYFASNQEVTLLPTPPS
jgi:hypothetical protein